MVSIYALINPLTSLVFYIGASQDVQARFYDHLSYHTNSYKSSQIQSILNNKLRPEILILDTCEVKDVRFWEEFYIDLFISFGFELSQMRTSNYPDGTNLGFLPTTIRFPFDILTALRDEAIRQNKSLNWLMIKIAKNFLDNLKINK